MAVERDRNGLQQPDLGDAGGEGGDVAEVAAVALADDDLADGERRGGAVVVMDGGGIRQEALLLVVRTLEMKARSPGGSSGALHFGQAASVAAWHSHSRRQRAALSKEIMRRRPTTISTGVSPCFFSS